MKTHQESRKLTLDAARLLLLRALAHEADTSLLHDLALPGIVRRLLKDMESRDPLCQERAVARLDAEYDRHGPALFRGLLEHGILLHTTHDLNSKFGNVLERLEADLAKEPWLRGALINELNRHFHSPYDPVRQLVEMILHSCSSIPNMLAAIIANGEADFDLRFAAASIIVENKEKGSYHAILEFLIEMSRLGASEAFVTGVLPLVQLFAKTGGAGLDIAISKFTEGKLGKHAPFILASFEEVFHAWFMRNPPEPSEDWIRVLVLAWPRGRLVSRLRMLEVLVDDWGRSEFAVFIRDNLRRRILDKPAYLDPAGEMAKTVKIWVFGTGDPESDERQISDALVRAASSGGKDWDAFADCQPLNRSEGRAAASACLQASTQARAHIFRWIESRANPRFQTSAYNHLLNLDAFLALAPDDQLFLLRSNALPKRVQAERLEMLLQVDGVQPQVRNELQEVLNRIIIEYKQGLSDDDEGDLS